VKPKPCPEKVAEKNKMLANGSQKGLISMQITTPVNVGFRVAPRGAGYLIGPDREELGGRPPGRSLAGDLYIDMLYMYISTYTGVGI
jgi:hypothetical protein